MNELLGRMKQDEDVEQTLNLKPEALEELLKLGEVGNTMADALSKFQSQMGSFTKVDRKAAVSEKRKVNMKWCEEQRLKLQDDYNHLKAVRDILESFRNDLIEDCSNRVRVERNVVKMLNPNECSGSVPPELQEIFDEEFRQSQNSKRKKKKKRSL